MEDPSLFKNRRTHNNNNDVRDRGCGFICSLGRLHLPMHVGRLSEDRKGLFSSSYRRRLLRLYSFGSGGFFPYRFYHGSLLRLDQEYNRGGFLLGMEGEGGGALCLLKG